MTEEDVKRIVQKEMAPQKTLERHYEASDARVLRAVKRQGLYERQIKKIKLEVDALIMPMKNWALSIKETIQGLAGVRENTLQNSTAFVTYITSLGKKMVLDKRHIEWMQRENDMYEAKKDTMKGLTKVLEFMKIQVYTVFTGFASIATILAVLGIAIAVFSLAIQGTESPLYELFMSLGNLDKVLFIMGAISVLGIAIGGVFALLGIAIGGFVLVLSGKLGPKLSVIVTLLSTVALVMATVIVGVASAPVLIGIAIMGILVLIFRFRKTLYSVTKDLGRMIWDHTLGWVLKQFKNLLKGFKKTWLGKKLFGSGGDSGAALSAGSSLSGVGYHPAYQDNSTVNITVSGGGGSAANNRALARDISTELTRDKRRRGGTTTQGAVP